jgi:hypothetical protein
MEAVTVKLLVDGLRVFAESMRAPSRSSRQRRMLCVRGESQLSRIDD